MICENFRSHVYQLESITYFKKYFDTAIEDRYTIRRNLGMSPEASARSPYTFQINGYITSTRSEILTNKHANCCSDSRHLFRSTSF